MCINMEFAFLDESGDLGKDSKYLVLTLVCTRKNKEITKIIRKTKQKLLQKNKSAKWLNQHGGEIKFYGFPDKNLLKKLLLDLSKIDMHIYFLCFEKKGMKVNQNIKTTILHQLFIHSFEKSNKIFPEKIIADLNFFNKNKKNYFILQKYEKKVISEQKDEKNKGKKRLEITFSSIDENEYLNMKGRKDITLFLIEQKNSRQSEMLQAVDVISGSIFYKFEKDKDEYFKLLNSEKMKISGFIFKRNK